VRFEVFAAANIRVEFWVVMLCSVVVVSPLTERFSCMNDSNSSDVVHVTGLRCGINTVLNKKLLTTHFSRDKFYNNESQNTDVGFASTQQWELTRWNLYTNLERRTRLRIERRDASTSSNTEHENEQDTGNRR